MNHSKSEYVTTQYFSCELLLIYVSNNSISNINIQEQFENKVTLIKNGRRGIRYRIENSVEFCRREQKDEKHLCTKVWQITLS